MEILNKFFLNYTIITQSLLWLTGIGIAAFTLLLKERFGWFSHFVFYHKNPETIFSSPKTFLEITEAKIPVISTSQRYRILHFRLHQQLLAFSVLLFSLPFNPCFFLKCYVCRV